MKKPRLTLLQTHSFGALLNQSLMLLAGKQTIRKPISTYPSEKNINKKKPHHDKKNLKKRIKSHKISHKKFHSRQGRAIYTKEVVRLISLFHNYFCCDHLYQFYIRLWTCDRAVAKLKIHGKGSKTP